MLFLGGFTAFRMNALTPYSRMAQLDYVYANVRASAVLTNGYVAGTVIPQNIVGMRNQLIILAKFTIGSLTDAQLKIEFSNDQGTTWYQEAFSSVSTTTDTLSLGVRKLGATGNYRIALPICPGCAIRISAIGTGTVTDSLLLIDAIVGVV